MCRLLFFLRLQVIPIIFQQFIASENAGEAKLVIEYTRSDLEERLEAVRIEAEKYQDDQTMSQTSRYATAEYVRNLWDRELNLIYSSSS